MYRKNKSELKEKQFSNFRYTSIPSANKDFEETQVIFSYKGRDYKYFSFIKKDPNFKKEDYLKHVQQEIAEAARSGRLLKIVKAYPKKKEPKKILRKPIIVTAAIGVVAATFLGLTIWQATLYTGDYHKVTWVDENNNVLEVDRVKHGTMPEYHSELPTKPDTEIDEAGNQYRYTFNKWDKELAPVTEDITYRAEMKAHSLVTVLEVGPRTSSEDGYYMTDTNCYFVYVGDLDYVDWGDGTVNQSTTHAYEREDYYTIKIYGEIERLSICADYSQAKLVGGYFINKLSYSYSINAITSNSIDDSDFQIKEIFIPSSVRRIEDEGLEGPRTITTITFEDGMDLEYMGSFAFSWLPNLTKLDFGYNFHARCFGCWLFNGTTNLASINFKDGTRIDDFECSFANSNLDFITFGNNCHIGELTVEDIAGWNPSTLSYLSFGDNCTIDGIGAGAFREDSSLMSVTFGNNCKIGAIGEHAFDSCTTLTTVSFGDNCEIPSIGACAFNYCNSLSTVTFGENCKINEIGDDAFAYCGLTHFTLPETCDLKYIGVEAFAYCGGLLSFNMPDSVSAFGGDCFCSCSNLQYVKLSANIEAIPYDAFYGCESLTSIRIPRKVKSIGDYAFNGCDSLTSVTFEEDSELEVINSDAFNLSENSESTVRDLVLPEGLKTICVEGFHAWECLETLTLPNSLEYVGSGAFDRCFSLETVNWPSEPRIHYIGANAFRGINVESLEIPTSVKTIDEGAFSGENNVPNNVKRLKLHNNVDFIGAKAFINHQISIVDLTELDHVPSTNVISLVSAFDEQLNVSMMRFYVKDQEMKTKFIEELQGLKNPHEVIVGEAPAI